MPTKPTKRRAGKREYGYVVQLHRGSVVVTDTSAIDPRWVTQLSRRAAEGVAQSLGVDLIYRLVPVRVVKARRSK